MSRAGGGARGNAVRALDLPEIATPVFATLALGAVYLATLAPGLTFWDSGELIAAVHSLGIPHPPGTPLYVMLAYTWSDLLPSLSIAAATNSFSALTTALAVGALAWILVRATRAPWAALGAALTAGAMSTVWLDANEAEVYGAALLLGMAMLLAAERAGAALPSARSLDQAAVQRPADQLSPTRDRLPTAARWTILTAYLMALAVPLHIGALVAGPAAVVLAANVGARGVSWPRAAALSGAFAVSVGAGLAEWKIAAVGLLVVALSPLFTRQNRASHSTTAALVALVLALGISAVAFMPIRSLHAPALDSGSPTSWSALWDVIGRRQYESHGLWPRQAPLWAQLANLFEYADWQVALGLAPGVAPSWVRTPFTLVFALLGVHGAARHREMDKRSWLAFVVLMVCASIGLVIYMNFKAGSSFGYGVLPDALPHEARERDYFFSLAFFTWGAWAGFGAVRLLAERSRSLIPLGIALAALPVALNWRAVDRSREPGASAPRRVAAALLWSAPQRAVLVTWGDNDSFPLWYLQEVEARRRDVRVVVAPLLGAEWYRRKLALRDSLLAASDVVGPQNGVSVLERIVERASVDGRPLAVAITADSSDLRSLGDEWVLNGVAYVSGPSPATAVAVRGLEAPVDTTAAREFVKLFGRDLPLPGNDATDPAPRVMARLLNCPGAALSAARAEARVDSLASGCKWR